MAENAAKKSTVQKNSLDTIVGFIVIVPLVCLVNYYFVSWLTNLFYGWSLYLGLFWSVWCTVIMVTGIWALRSAVAENPSGGFILLFGMIASPVVGFAGGAAAIGFGLEKLGLASYTGAGADNFRVLYKHFLWQFLDMIPELDIWKVLRIEDPAVESGLYAGLLLIAYKIVVIYAVLETLKKLLDD